MAIWIEEFGVVVSNGLSAKQKAHWEEVFPEETTFGNVEMRDYSHVAAYSRDVRRHFKNLAAEVEHQHGESAGEDEGTADV